MSNVRALFREAVPADYVEISPGLFALSWDEARLAPGALCNDPILGAAEYNKHLRTRAIPPTDSELAKFRALFAQCLSQSDDFELLLAVSLKNAINPAYTLPSSFSAKLASLTNEQKNTIFYILNSSHLAQIALKSSDLARLTSLNIVLM